MAVNPSNALALDAQSLNSLKRTARDDPQQALRQTAKQFEAMFMSMLLKSMRETMPGGDQLSSDAGKAYTGMLDSQLAQKMSDKGIGLADMMVKQLERSRAALKPGANGTVPQAAFNPEAQPAKPSAGPSAGEPAKAAPREFVSRMRSHAEAASRQSGIPADFMLGQAGLESGWGKREIRAADGSATHNIFGVKAGRDWNGKTVDIVTTEYSNGTPRKVVERFRAYGSYAEAFSDYGRMVAGNGRYAHAVRAGGDAGRFAQGMQAGGYATDPRYAEKLTSAINRAREIRVSA